MITQVGDIKVIIVKFLSFLRKFVGNQSCICYIYLTC